MKQVLVSIVALALSLNIAQAQDKKQQKAAAVTAAKATVAADKADLKRNREARDGPGEKRREGRQESHLGEANGYTYIQVTGK